jgi:hypothetical protein
MKALGPSGVVLPKGPLAVNNKQCNQGEFMGNVDYAKELEAIGQALKVLSPLKEAQRRFVLETIQARLGLNTRPAGSTERPGGVPGVGTAKQAEASSERSTAGATPRAFLSQKKPKSEGERMACLAYYLTHVKDKAHFKTRELTDLNVEAAGVKFPNPSRAAGDALTKYNYFVPGTKGCRQLSPLGESVVEALPDRDAVKKAIEENRPKARRSRNGKK